LRIHFFVEIVGDVPPNFLAIDFDRFVDHDVVLISNP
jgi:hypothetical protein